jgi:hypothetical protein
MAAKQTIMIAPENPPGSVVRIEAQKAAADNGFRLERGIENGWLHYGSTTAPGSLWIASASSQGPWLLSINHSGVVAEIGNRVARVALRLLPEFTAADSD